MFKAFKRALGVGGGNKLNNDSINGSAAGSQPVPEPSIDRPTIETGAPPPIDLEANHPTDPNESIFAYTHMETVDYSCPGGTALADALQGVVIDQLSSGEAPLEQERQPLDASQSQYQPQEQGTDILEPSDTHAYVEALGLDGSVGAVMMAGAGSDPTAMTPVEPLTSVVYLMEEEDRMDARSVVSDVITEEELVEELQGLSRAITIIEEEAGIVPTSPSAASAVSSGTAPFGSSPTHQSSMEANFGAGFASGASPYDLCRLYNDLGLRLMDAKDYEQALTMLRKAEALVDNDLPWAAYDESQKAEKQENGTIKTDGEEGSSHSKSMDDVEESEEERANRRSRLKAITYNNLGCLFKRRGLPQVALGYLQRALIVSEASGQVHNCCSTLLNICAAYSAMKRCKEALTHAERAIVLLQRHLWGQGPATFQEGIAALNKLLNSVPAADKYRLLGSVNVLAMAYHNAAVEHERLGRWTEAGVSYARACSIGAKFLGAKCATTISLTKAQKAFNARQQKALNALHASSSMSGTLKRAPGTISSRPPAGASSSKRAAGSSKRTGVYTSSTAARSGGMRLSKSSGSLTNLSKGTLPLDKVDKVAPSTRTLGEKLAKSSVKQ